MSDIGDRIKKARRSENLTQAQLGARCGMADSAIRRYESGRGNPTLDTIQRIANALGVPAGELLGSVPQPDREYESLCDTLASSGLCIAATGFGEGPDEDGDHYYIWRMDAESPENDKTEWVYRDLLRVVKAVQGDAEARRTEYIRRRLNIELL